MGERLALALGAAATVIVIGGYLGNGFRGIEHIANAQRSYGSVVSTAVPLPTMSRVAA